MPLSTRSTAPVATPAPARLDTAVVVGGGVGGAAAALLLARGGTTVTLLERSPDPVALGAGILLQANGLAVLHGLGLRAGVERASARVDAVRLHRADGSPLSGRPVPDLGEGLDHLRALRRSTLARVLEGAVAQEPLITVLLGAEATGAGPDGTVTYVSGPADERTSRSVQADLVVGADGVGSAVRGHGDFGADVTATGSVYLRGLVDVVAPFQGEAWTELGLFGSSDIGRGAYFYAAATHPLVARALDDGDLPGMRALWVDAFPPCRALWDALPRLDDLLVNDVRTVRCRRYVDGRLVLLGDAAHAMEPTAGQGANSALVDAAVLSRELATAPSVDAALHRYDAVRRPAVTRVQRDAHRLARLSAVRSPFGRAARDRLLRLADRKVFVNSRYRRLQQEDPATLRAGIAETWS